MAKLFFPLVLLLDPGAMKYHIAVISTYIVQYTTFSSFDIDILSDFTFVLLAMESPDQESKADSNPDNLCSHRHFLCYYALYARKQILRIQLLFVT
jgi:hypothetical protein